jgi:hypothetical protein
MKRRNARASFSTAQLGLWDELEALKPAPVAHPPVPAEGAPHASAPLPGPAQHAPHGGAR